MSLKSIIALAESKTRGAARMLAIQVFLYLQLLDFLTTMVGFRIGAGELSPFTRWLMLWGPIAGVALSKLIAILLGGLCIWRRRGRVISWANYRSEERRVGKECR